VKLKLDENLPETLLVELAALNHDTDNVRQEGLAGHDDSEVWTAAQASGRFLITQDLDFSDVRRFKTGTHHGLLLVRLPDAGRSTLTRRIIEVFRREDVEGARVVIVTDASPHRLVPLEAAVQDGLVIVGLLDVQVRLVEQRHQVVRLQRSKQCLGP